MNFNASGGRQPHKLGAKRLRQGVDVTNTPNAYPPPYDPFAQPNSNMMGFEGGFTPNLNPNQFSPSPAAMDFLPPATEFQQGQIPPQFMEGHSVNHHHQSRPPRPFPEGPTGNHMADFSIPSQLLGNTMVQNAAMQYGQQLMGTGKQYMDKEFEKYVPVSRLKYYFAVDTAYVYKKLGLVLFPFAHKDWSIKYAADEPIQPRFELNAPDLYIPTMAYLTYVLVAGLALGIQNRFTPESLGIQASSALAWTILEILVHLVSVYITAISTALTMIDILAYCGYKFIGIIIAVLTSLIFKGPGYYLALLYLGVSLAFFLVRSLKIKILPVNATAGDPYTNQYQAQSGNKRRLYLLLFMAGVQPFLMWLLSYHLVPTTVAS